jgi:hypothetical protein
MATPTNLPADFVPGAILTAAQMDDLRGAFRILQVVSGSTTTAVTNSTNTFTDTGLTATITPQATSNRILVIIAQQVFKNNANSENRVSVRTMRDATQIATSGGLLLYTALASFNQATYSLCLLDNPATTSAITYKTQAMNPNNTAQMQTQPDSSNSTMILMEVSL